MPGALQDIDTVNIFFMQNPVYIFSSQQYQVNLLIHPVKSNSYHQTDTQL